MLGSACCCRRKFASDWLFWGHHSVAGSLLATAIKCLLGIFPACALQPSAEVVHAASDGVVSSVGTRAMSLAKLPVLQKVWKVLKQFVGVDLPGLRRT